MFLNKFQDYPSLLNDGYGPGLIGAMKDLHEVKKRTGIHVQCFNSTLQVDHVHIMEVQILRFFHSVLTRNIFIALLTITLKNILRIS